MRYPYLVVHFFFMRALCRTRGFFDAVENAHSILKPYLLSWVDQISIHPATLRADSMP